MSQIVELGAITRDQVVAFGDAAKLVQILGSGILVPAICIACKHCSVSKGPVVSCNAEQDMSKVGTIFQWDSEPKTPLVNICAGFYPNVVKSGVCT